MIAQTSLLPLILIALLAGLLVGILVTYLVIRRPASDGAAERELEALRSREKRLKEVASLWRERSGGHLIVWSGGKPLVNAQVLAAVDRQQLEEAGHEFLAWLGTAPREAPAVPPLAPSPSAVTPAIPQNITPVALPAAAIPGVISPVEEPKPDKPLSIVEQINAILKEMVAGSPLEKKGIRLVEDQRKGVVVWIGLEHFDGVESVTDPQIRDTLRAAAAEWERRAERARH